MRFIDPQDEIEKAYDCIVLSDAEGHYAPPERFPVPMWLHANEPYSHRCYWCEFLTRK